MLTDMTHVPASLDILVLTICATDCELEVQDQIRTLDIIVKEDDPAKLTLLFLILDVKHSRNFF